MLGVPPGAGAATACSRSIRLRRIASGRAVLGHQLVVHRLQAADRGADVAWVEVVTALEHARGLSGAAELEQQLTPVLGEPGVVVGVETDLAEDAPDERNRLGQRLGRR